jgi:Flp pilus assembly protein TadG
MNNKGQTLVIFVFLLPIILGLVAFLVDSSLIMYQDNRLDRINEVALDYAIKKKDTITNERIIELILKNDKDIKIDLVNVTSSKIIIKTRKEFDSLFGRVLDFKKYTVKSSIEKTIG